MTFLPLETNTPKANEITKNLQLIQEELKAASRLSKEQMKHYYNQKHQKTPEYKIGTMVMLDAQNIDMTAPSKTLADKWLGPYPIKEKVSSMAYRLKLPQMVRLHPTFHVALLAPYIGDERNARPPPMEVEGDEEYGVEKILDGWLWRKQKQYLMKWQGYPDSENTWEPATGLKHAPEAVSLFHDSHPLFQWLARKRTHPCKAPVET